MDRSASSSRRRFLSGAAVGATAAFAGCTSVYGALPNRVTYARTRFRDVPSVPAAVETTDDHLHDLATEIDAYADGLEVWDRIDGPERRVVYSSRRLENALEFADSLPSEPPTIDTVETAGYHLSQAAGSDAYARVRADEFDRDPTAGAERWLDERASVQAEFDYETEAPSTFLAYGRAVEYSLRQAELGLSRLTDAEIDDGSRHASRAERIADLYGNTQRHRLRVRDARGYRKALRERDSGGEPFGETMAASRDVLAGRVSDLLADRDIWMDRTADFGDERRDVHSALYSRSLGERVETIDRIVDGGYEVYGTVELATLWLRFAAARAERDRLEAADEDRLDSGLVDAAKRDAVDRLEDVLESDPDPLALFFADRARSRLDSGDRSLERTSFDDDEDWRWMQANGYAHYLLARGILERIDEAVDVLATGG
ncbi:hypothetical protein CV102_11525 [Natronococcus pandeyae]|uniref:Uncharacterized protein n=1 Tax=Natronococcus pandeyae TaxID=2055836 RepID=A0A8J8Q2Y8_9EURY|nr:hypothetical protein [Natronococcus pandeyae]TYL38431.1 hypothetical protein CV102_11525 [Natronococcus pandeyae]